MERAIAKADFLLGLFNPKIRASRGSFGCMTQERRNAKSWTKGPLRSAGDDAHLTEIKLIPSDRIVMDLAGVPMRKRCKHELGFAVCYSTETTGTSRTPSSILSMPMISTMASCRIGEFSSMLSPRGIQRRPIVMVYVLTRRVMYGAQGSLVG